MIKQSFKNIGNSWFTISQKEYDKQLSSIIKSLEGSTILFRIIKHHKPYSYIDTYHILGNSLRPQLKRRTIKEEIDERYRDFREVRKVYVKEYHNFIDVKVIIDMEIYNYDLMEQIFNTAEFPLKENNTHKLINFDYIPTFATAENLVDPFSYELIFNKDLIESDAINSIAHMPTNDTTNYFEYQTI